MPFLMRNRSFYNTYYEIDGSEPGEYTFIVSGWGNEPFQQKYKKISRKDVVGVINLNYYNIRPVRNHYGDIVGTHVQQVQSVNLNGSIPDMYKSKMARDSARRITRILDFLRSRELCRCPRHNKQVRDEPKSDMKFNNRLSSRLKDQQNLIGRVSLSHSPTNIAIIKLNSNQS